jgi:glutamyl-tRNA synthetase
MTIRTRFAPSPTGYLHLGSARTALFNWAFARHHEGVFVLRVEDTDRERSTAESERAVLDGLRWLGLDWDEGPTRQSERGERHAEVIEDLLARSRAYRCICTREELEERKQRAEGRRAYNGTCRDKEYGPDCGAHTVRLRLPLDADLSWDDLVFGPSGQEAAQVGDMIIRRSDGGPLYNLAVVVDDIDMNITHVIRGGDHHPNTPLQIAIYQAMGAPLPYFAHVPLIVGPSGKKLSKRRDPVSIQDFRDQGVLAQALRNWLVRIGWSHGDDEVFSQDDIARLFDLDSVGRSAAQADPGKLEWLGMHYLKELPMPELLTSLDPYLEPLTGAPAPRDPGFAMLLDLLRERSTTLCEMASQARFAAVDSVETDEKAAKKFLKPASLPILESLSKRLSELVAAPSGTPNPGDASSWSETGIEQVFEAVRAEHDDIGMGKLAQPVRVAVTGTSVSPGIYETLVALGKDKTVRRIDETIERVRSSNPGNPGN